VTEARELGMGYDDAVAAVTAVTAIRPPFRYVTLSPERKGPVSAATGLHGDGNLVNKEAQDGERNYAEGAMEIVFFPRRVAKTTVPAAVAKSVSSLPRPTLVPGWKWVPRCRTIISPAFTNCPPKRFTPRRCA